jgi:hypothetical protein
MLRYEPPFRGHYRYVLNDTELCGVRLPAGSRLLLLWGAANRDPSHFDNAGQFRLDRPIVKSHIAFGKGVHFCVGAALARLEAGLALSRPLERTANFAAADTGRWLPSLLVRRLGTSAPGTDLTRIAHRCPSKSPVEMWIKFVVLNLLWCTMPLVTYFWGVSRLARQDLAVNF